MYGVGAIASNVANKTKKVLKIRFYFFEINFHS